MSLLIKLIVEPGTSAYHIFSCIVKGNWNYFAAIRNEKRAPKLEATHLEKAKELYTKVLFFSQCNLKTQVPPIPTIPPKRIKDILTYHPRDYNLLLLFGGGGALLLLQTSRI